MGQPTQYSVVNEEKAPGRKPKESHLAEWASGFKDGLTIGTIPLIIPLVFAGEGGETIETTRNYQEGESWGLVTGYTISLLCWGAAGLVYGLTY